MSRVATLVAYSDRQGVDRGYGMALGAAACYRLSEPLTFEGRYDEATDSYPMRSTRYVWVSTAQVCGEWETYAFASYANGKVHMWRELRGSRKDELDHTVILENLGYEVAYSVGRKPRAHRGGILQRAKKVR